MRRDCFPAQNAMFLIAGAFTFAVIPPPSSVIGAWICRVNRAARYSIPIFGHRS